MIDTIVFVLAAAVVLVGAIGVVIRTNPVHCALHLVMTLFGVAVLFVSLEANFLAAVQVIVYAGAVVVLFLFVIMLLRCRPGREPDGRTDQGSARRWPRCSASACWRSCSSPSSAGRA